MNITIDLPPEIEESIKSQAAKDGLPLEAYVKSLVQEATRRRDRIEMLSESSIDEVLAPFRRNVEESGMSDDELDELFTKTRLDVILQKRESNPN